MDQLIDAVGLYAALAQAVDDAVHELRRGAKALGLNESPVFLVEAEEVGEGSANIDRNDKHEALRGLVVGWRRTASVAPARQWDNCSNPLRSRRW